MKRSTITSNGLSGWNLAASITAAIAAMGMGHTANAQNLLANSSFESSGGVVDFGDLFVGMTTFNGPDGASLAPWFIPAGTDIEYYFPRLDGARSIQRVPHGSCVIGMNWNPSSGALGRIQQSFSSPYPKSTVPFYAMVGDFAGDRAYGTQRWASVGSSLKITSGATVNYWDSFFVPNYTGPNTTSNSVFVPRVVKYAAFGPGPAMDGTFAMWDNDDQGVLADAVHLFPVHQEDLACGDWRWLSGFSILENGTWSASTPSDPWQDLKFGSPSGCSCSSDNKFLTMNSALGGASTMLITAWDQYSTGTRGTLKLTLDIQSVTTYCPQALVSFYDWNNFRWTVPSAALPKFPPFAGFKVKAGDRCYTTDWASYDVREPAPNSNTKTPLASYVDPATGMVLARVIFSNGNAVNPDIVKVPCPTCPPPPPTPWTIKVHSAKIECK